MKPWVSWALVGFVALLLVVVRVEVSGRRAMERGLALASAGEGARALDELSAAARWYLPGSTRVRAALVRLTVLGEEAEGRGDVEGALAAYREARGCIRAVRSLWVPNADLAGPIDRRIAHLMAGQGERDHAGNPASFDAREAEHLALLTADRSPDPGWSLVAVLAFFGFIAAAFVFVGKAWDAQGRFHSAAALRWGGVVVFGIAVWVVALGQA